VIGETCLIENETLKDLYIRFEYDFNPAFKYTDQSKKLVIFILEYYYFRIDSNLSAIFILEELKPKYIKAEIVIAGGSSGFLGFSWGSEKSMLKKILKFLKK
jgi:hypothetical protein